MTPTDFHNASAAPLDSPILWAQQLAVTAPRGRRLLEDISFSAYSGQVVGLIGPNGAGKSTLLGALAGDLPRSQGQISLAGLDPQRARPQQLARLRAVMLQDVSVAFSFLVREVVAMGRRPWAGTAQAAADEEIIDSALQACDITHLATRDVMTLSGGERARVALARVLAQQTPVVFLDEPTAALDIAHQEQALGLVRAVADAGAAVVVVLHDLNAAAAYCDQLVCLSNGRVAAAGPVAEVLKEPLLHQIYGWPVAVVRRDSAPQWQVIPQPAQVAPDAYRVLQRRLTNGDINH